jgi:hypothetical protein
MTKRMNASGESASTIASTLGVSGATVYRVLATSPASEGWATTVVHGLNAGATNRCSACCSTRRFPIGQ